MAAARAARALACGSRQYELQSYPEDRGFNTRAYRVSRRSPKPGSLNKQTVNCFPSGSLAFVSGDVGLVRLIYEDKAGTKDKGKTPSSGR